MEQTLCIFNRTLPHKGKGQEIKLNLKAVTMIDHVRGSFEIELKIPTPTKYHYWFVLFLDPW